MRYVNCNALNASDSISGNGIQIDSNQLISCSFQAVFGDDTAAGTLKLQMSNDIDNNSHQPSNFVVTNWTDIPNATATITAGASAVIFLSNMCYRWIRCVYTSSSGGSSTILVNMMALSM